NVREKDRVYIEGMLALSGMAGAERAAERIFALETRLAKGHWTRVENRDAEKTYNRFDRAGLENLMPTFDWDAFFAGANVPPEKVQAVIVNQPSYFEALDREISGTPLEDWRAYFRFRLLNTYAPDLSSPFVKLHFEFNSRTFSGVTELQPRWKWGVSPLGDVSVDLDVNWQSVRHF